MKTELTIFENTVLRAKIRTFMVRGEPWFVATDIAESLGYSNTSDAISTHCKHAKSLKTLAYSDSREALPINSLAIPESDLYRLIMRSKLPSAEAFQDWVAEEVLPSIRKTGAYLSPMMTAQQMLDLIEHATRLMNQLGGMDERDELFYKDLIRNQFSSQILTSDTDIEPRREWPISDRVLVITGHKPARNDVIAVGKRMASAYRAEHGQNPPKREQYVDGATRVVYHYDDRDLPMLDRVITEYYS